MKKILLIEDEPIVRETTVDLLELEGFEVTAASNGKIGLQAARKFLPDLILCDIMMPELDGYEVLDGLLSQPATASIPFIFLSAKTDKHAIRHGMELGADDYLTKPFSRSELIGAIQARLKKREREQEHLPPKSVANSAEIFIIEGLNINFAERRVTLNKLEIKLTAQQYDLLAYLVKNAGRVITHQAALSNVWGPEYERESHYLHVFINQLRSKIEADPAHPQFIITERGVGYRFKSLTS